MSDHFEPGTELLRKIYSLLHSAYGSQHWWPAKTPFEVMVGAVLTQNTSWQNARKAIANLRKNRALNPVAIMKLSELQLQELIRPSGFFRVKASRLKSYVSYFRQTYGGRVSQMEQKPLNELRVELLRVHGIGRETADSILLYALNKPTFVVDAYTRRILLRHRLITENASYEQVRQLFEQNLPVDVGMFNEYHALLVRLAKTHCRRKPQCDSCPLRRLLPHIAWDWTRFPA